jgi:hypothetical protein
MDQLRWQRFCRKPGHQTVVTEDQMAAIHREIRERAERIETEARRLARSGQHQGFSTIQFALAARGYREAAKVLANRWTQCELDRFCAQARQSI